MKKNKHQKIIALLIIMSLFLPLLPNYVVLATNQEPEELITGESNTPEPPSETLLNETEEIIIPVETTDNIKQDDEIVDSDKSIENEENEEIDENTENNESVFDSDGSYFDNLISEEKAINNGKPYEVVDVLPRDQEMISTQSVNSSSYSKDLEYVNILEQNKYNPKASQDLSISTENGNVGYTYNIATIPGPNNSVMSLDIEYNSTESKFADALADITDAKDYFLEPNLAYDTDEQLGAGWKFTGIKRSFPDGYYLLKDGDVVRNSKNNKYKYYTISNNTISYIDGTIERLNSEGYIESIEDKYGNKISYEYEMYTDSKYRDACKLTSITDSQNRKIAIDYFDDYIQITRPDGTELRLNIEDRNVEHIASERGFDATLPARIVNSIYDVSTRSYIAEFGYKDIYFNYICFGTGGGVSTEDCGVYMAMTSCSLPYNGSHYIDYDVFNDDARGVSIPYVGLKYWYLCAAKDYTTSEKTDLRASYEYKFSANRAGGTGTEIAPNNRITKDTGSKQEVFERKDGVDILKKKTEVSGDRRRPNSVETITYNSNGNYISSRVDYTYDTYGNVLTAIQKVDNTVKLENKYTYYNNSYKSLKDVTTKKGTTIFNKTEYEVNTLGDVTSEKIYDEDNNLQRRTKYSYSNNNLIQTTLYDPVTAIACRIEKYSYTGPYMTRKAVLNSSGNVIECTYYSYDYNTGKITEIVDANGREKIYYDALGRIIQEKHPDGTSKDIEYNHIDNSVRITDENSYQLEYFYNAYGKVNRVAEYNSAYGLTNLQRAFFDLVGNPITVMDALDNPTNIGYDVFGRQISITRSKLSSKTDIKYLDVIIEGNNKYSVYLKRSETGRISCEYYDIYGRLAKTALIKNYSSFNSSSFDDIAQMPSNAEFVVTSRYVYDDLDRVIEQYDGENRPTYYTYDTMGNVINMKQGNGGNGSPQINISYEYDGAGNVTKTTQGTHITKYEYDIAGRLVKMTDPIGYTETYTYDTAGNVKTAKDKNGVTTTNTYNNRGLLSKTEKGSEYIEYTYDGVGNLLTSTDNSGTITYAYNKDRTLKTKTYPDGKSIKYTYNANKLRTSMTDCLGNTTNYTYNSRGELMLIDEKYAGTNTTNTTKYAYNVDGTVQKVTYPLSSYTTTQYTYDYAGRISNLTNKLTSSSTYSTHAYTYDNSGNITQKTESISGTAKTTKYTYDDVNRLKTEYISGIGTNTYTYDQYNNLISEIGLGDIYYYYDANNRMIGHDDLWGYKETEDGPLQATWESYFEYDKNGNLLSYNMETNHGVKSNQKSYTYDVWNRLTNFKDSLGATTDYNYYSDGFCANIDEYKKYYYDGDNIINEIWDDDYYFTNVVGIGGYISRSEEEGTGYFFKDARGDVLSAYSSTSTQLVGYSYDAWGNSQQTTPETAWSRGNTIRYNGQYYDEDSGMTYLRARYYDSTIRRFITEDPHWNVDNMIYGDEQQAVEYRIVDNTKIYYDKYGNVVEKKEYVPDVFTSIRQNNLNNTVPIQRIPDVYSISQSANLYTYCLNNPILYNDMNGESVWGVGTEALIGFGFGVSGQCFRVEDDKGNQGTIFVGNFGIETGASFSVEGFYFPNMDSIYDLRGEGFSMGASGTYGGSWIGTDKYRGIAVSRGFGSPEIHITVGYTWLFV